MTICIFPGTFNPIHNAHIRMAKTALDKYGFEKIIFIPSYLPPHKEINGNLADHRMNMVKLATKNEPKFEVSDIEYSSDSTSYSLVTVKKIIEQYNIKDRLNFLIGTDAFEKIETWYKADELKNLVHFIVCPRLGDSFNNIEESLRVNGWNFEVMKMEYINISSTEIRKNHTQINTDKKVGEYIKRHELYN